MYRGCGKIAKTRRKLLKQFAIFTLPLLKAGFPKIPELRS